MMDKLEESYKIRVELMRHEQKVLPTYLPACPPAYLNNSMEQRPF